MLIDIIIFYQTLRLFIKRYTGR